MECGSSIAMPTTSPIVSRRRARMLICGGKKSWAGLKASGRSLSPSSAKARPARCACRSALKQPVLAISLVLHVLAIWSLTRSQARSLESRAQLKVAYPLGDLQLLSNCPDALRLQRCLGANEAAGILRPLGLNEQIRLAHGQPPLRSPPCVICQSTLSASPQRQEQNLAHGRTSDIRQRPLRTLRDRCDVLLSEWRSLDEAA